MDSESLRLLKLYMHVDHDDDDKLIAVLWSAACLYLFDGDLPPGDDSWLAAAAKTLEWYDGTPIQPGLQSLINQLKFRNPTF